jgi:hypothetical protein
MGGPLLQFSSQNVQLHAAALYGSACPMRQKLLRNRDRFAGCPFYDLVFGRVPNFSTCESKTLSPLKIAASLRGYRISRKKS